MPHVQTVTGPVAPENLGFVLPHEHTACELWHIDGREDYWELTADDAVLPAEIRGFRSAGGGTIVDQTLPGMSRDPERLRRWSLETGVNIVMGAGWYRAPFYPVDAFLDRRSVEAIADELVREATDGVGATGIRPGIYGEIGTDKPWISPIEERVHRAVARAASRTGLPIGTHALMSAVGIAQLTVFEEEGADPTRVVIGHADSHPVLEYYLEIIRRGACVEFDLLGTFDLLGVSFTPAIRHREAKVIRLLLELLDRGHVDRVLLSHDICHNGQLKAYGGNGYLYLFEQFLPTLREAGVPEAAIHTMTVENPARILTVASSE